MFCYLNETSFYYLIFTLECLLFFANIIMFLIRIISRTIILQNVNKSYDYVLAYVINPLCTYI